MRNLDVILKPDSYDRNIVNIGTQNISSRMLEGILALDEVWGQFRHKSVITYTKDCLDGKQYYIKRMLSVL